MGDIGEEDQLGMSGFFQLLRKLNELVALVEQQESTIRCYEQAIP